MTNAGFNVSQDAQGRNQWTFANYLIRPFRNRRRHLVYPIYKDEKQIGLEFNLINAKDLAMADINGHPFIRPVDPPKQKKRKTK